MMPSYCVGSEQCEVACVAHLEALLISEQLLLWGRASHFVFSTLVIRSGQKSLIQNNSFQKSVLLSFSGLKNIHGMAIK